MAQTMSELDTLHYELPIHYSIYGLSILSLSYNIRSCCCQSLHAFTFSYDSTLLGHAMLYTKGSTKSV